jgi:uncharacterized protein (TIGR03437 family)
MKTKSTILVLAAWACSATAGGTATVPVHFEENVGQAPAEARFVARGAGFGMAIGPAHAEVGGVRMALLGADRSARGVGEQPIAARTSYIRGRDPALWRTGIANYRRVRFESVYRGIDVVYYGSGGLLEYDFVVRPGARAADIAMSFDAAPSLDKSGDLVLRTADGEVRHKRPVAYQLAQGKRRPVEARYSIAGDGRVGFALGVYDASRELVIDPLLQFSTFWGGQFRESASTIALDREGNVVVAGTSSSLDYPFTQSGFQRANRGQTDIFIVKINARGTDVLFSTLLGGNGDDTNPALAIDASNNVYVSGTTKSGDFPTTRGAFRENLLGESDGFVAKLASDGSRLVYSTRIGGRGEDVLRAIALDGNGAAVVTGETRSADFPVTADVFQTERKNIIDVFVTKIAPSGAGLEWSTLLGGDADTFIAPYESGRAVAVDRVGGVWVAGVTTMRDFPLKGAFQDFHLGFGDIFLTKFAPDAKTIDFSTFIGGEGDDTVTAMVVEPGFTAYLAGKTTGLRFPTTPNVFQPASYNDGRTLTEAFLMRVGAGGQPIFSTFFGGKGDDVINGIAVDGDGNATVIGTTSSPDLPISLDSFPRGIGSAVEAAPNDAFIATFSRFGNSLLYCTYLGGTANDEGNAIARDATGNLYIAGFTQSRNFPLSAGALRRSTGFGTNSAYIARIGDERPAPFSLSIVAGNGQLVDQEATAALPLTVELLDTFNAPLPQATITFTPSTNLTLSSNTAVTDGQGRARVFARAGLRVGAATVRASVGASVGALRVDFNLTIRRVGPAPPVIEPGGVYGAGGSVPPVRVISPLGQAIVKGEFLAPEGASLEAGPDVLVGGQVPVSLLGTCVTVGNAVARILSINDREVKFQVPEIPLGVARPVQVITNCGRTGELRSELEMVDVVDQSPEFLFWQRNADGRNPVLATSARNGVPVGPPGLPGLLLVAAQPEDEISIYTTGFGQTVPLFAVGHFPTERARTVETPVVLLDGRELPPENVLYSGVALNQLPGTYQIDIRVPRDTRNGNLNLVVRFGLRQTPPGAFLRVAGGLDLSPKLSVSPTRLDLGDVVINQPREVPLTVANSGTAPLEIASVSVPAQAVTVQPSIGFTLPAGEARVFTVRVLSNALGSISTQITIASSDPDTPVLNIPVTATVVVQPPTPNPAPVLQEILPDSVESGGAGFNLVVNGSGFARASVVELNGRATGTFFNHPGQLIATVSATDIALQGEIRVTVFSPEPGGGRSAPRTITVRGSNTAGGPSANINQLDLRFCPLVSAFVSVLDSAGVPVTGQTNASCTEDATPLLCRVGPAAPDVPLSVSIAYGLNGTTSDEERALLKNAVRQFVLSLGQDDRVQLIHLDDAREQTPFTANRDTVLFRIDDLRPLPGVNMVLDSAWTALQNVVREPGARRRAVVLFTAAANQGGAFQDYNQLVGSVRSANVPFFTYAIGPGGSNPALTGVLRQLARDSNGQFVAEPDGRAFGTRFSALSALLNNQYLVEFRATAVDARPKTIRLTFNTPDGPVTGTRTYTPCLAAGSFSLAPAQQ